MSNKKLLLILVVMLLIAFGGYTFLNKKNKQSAFMCGGIACGNGCCVANKCQEQGITIAGYTCFGDNKWKSPANETFEGTPEAVIAAVSDTGTSGTTDSIEDQIYANMRERQNNLQGSLISVWIYKDNIGPLGYENSKQLAYQKISQVHERVKSGSLTMAQAAEILKNDRELVQLGSFSLGNIYLKFDAGRRQTITVDPLFDDFLWLLSDGSVSDIYLARANSLEEAIEPDAVYMFAQIDKRT